MTGNKRHVYAYVHPIPIGPIEVFPKDFNRVTLGVHEGIRILTHHIGV